MDWIFKHKLIAATVVIVLAAVSWYLLAGSSSSSEAVLSAETPTIPPDAQQLVTSLDALRTVTLDGSIFSNPSFQALQDLSTPVVPEPVGRTDPFAPLSASEIAGGGATASSGQ